MTRNKSAHAAAALAILVVVIGAITIAAWRVTSLAANTNRAFAARSMSVAALQRKLASSYRMTDVALARIGAESGDFALLADGQKARALLEATCKKVSQDQTCAVYQISYSKNLSEYAATIKIGGAPSEALAQLADAVRPPMGVSSFRIASVSPSQTPEIEATLSIVAVATPSVKTQEGQKGQ